MLTAAVGGDRRVFEIRSCLGRGGFGEVYRATMTAAAGVRIEVAVKVLHDSDPSSQAVQRLRDEARMLGAVRHPSLLTLHGLVGLDGRIALVTEFVEGADLDRCVREADPVPRRALLEVIAKVSDALEAAWTAPAVDGNPLHLVHRDIKPANIRVGKHGEVKLLDFGIARAGNFDREARTETHAMLGSYLYMAPERFTAKADQGPGIDVFALGCTLYECLAGQRLFADLSLQDVYLLALEGDRYERFVQERLDALPPSVERAVVPLVYRMVERDPAARPGHAEVARLCRELADRTPGATLERWARARRWPPPKVVRGELDGARITESVLTDGVPVVAGGPSRRPRSDGSGTHTLANTEIGATFERDADSVIQRAVSATFERPGVVVGMGVGVVGLTASLVGAGLLLLLGIAVAWSSRSAPPPAPAPVAVAPVPAPPPPPIRPGPTPRPTSPPAPAVRAPAPPAPVAAPPPPAPASPAPASPAPEPAAPEPAAPEPAPPPVAVVIVEPVPAPASESATVTVTGSKVLVEFRGPQGTTRARALPPGRYDVIAWFDGVPSQVADATTFLVPGGSYTLQCSDLKQTCRWVP